MTARTNALVLAALLCGVSLGGVAARPSTKAGNTANAVSLEAIVPKSFGDWRELPDQATQIINPETKRVLDLLYSQLLSRTYIDRNGYKIMLSLAYGDDQRGGLQAHRPEVCYPAQGFKLSGMQDGDLVTNFGKIDVRRISTVLGSRNEPVTYWITVGDQVVKSAFDRRIAEIRLGLTGQVPDGLLFRISSIDTDGARAFAMQTKFAADMMAGVSPAARKRLSGLGES